MNLASLQSDLYRMITALDMVEAACAHHLCNSNARPCPFLYQASMAAKDIEIALQELEKEKELGSAAHHKPLGRQKA